MLHISEIFSNLTPLHTGTINEGQYLGCFIFALTSLVATILYFYVNCKKETYESEESDIYMQTPIEQAHSYATETESFVSYLRKLDKMKTQPPQHCRSIDFYLACRSSETPTLSESLIGTEEEEEAEKNNETMSG